MTLAPYVLWLFGLLFVTRLIWGVWKSGDRTAAVVTGGMFYVTYIGALVYMGWPT
jgi:hypothetical protein